MECSDCQATVLDVRATVDPRLMALTFRAQCGHRLTDDETKALWRGGMRWTLPVVDGKALVGAERDRQVYDEGYTPEHDAAQDDPNNLTWAAWCLLDAAASGAPYVDVPGMWPFDEERWKPDHEPLRRLVIAGAMIEAEIDRRLLEARGGEGRRGHAGEGAGVARPGDGS